MIFCNELQDKSKMFDIWLVYDILSWRSDDITFGLVLITVLQLSAYDLRLYMVYLQIVIMRCFSFTSLLLLWLIGLWLR